MFDVNHWFASNSFSSIFFKNILKNISLIMGQDSH
jgi:hypothetical protein